MYRPTEWGYILQFSVLETRYKWEKFLGTVSLALVEPLLSGSRDVRNISNLVQSTQNDYKCKLVSYIPEEQAPQMVPAERR